MNSFYTIFCLFLLPAFVICGPAVTVINSSTILEDNPTLNEANRTTKTEPLNFPLSIVKREVSNRENEQFSQHPYPMIMLKRTATVLNKIMYALQKSFDRSGPTNDNGSGTPFQQENGKSTAVGLPGATSANFEPYPYVQRRTQKDRKIYLRCYFNAVSCFKK